MVRERGSIVTVYGAISIVVHYGCVEFRVLLAHGVNEDGCDV